MVSSNAVLLPYIFPPDLVALGQLVRNPLAPNIDTCREGCSLLQGDDISSPDPEQPYKTIVRVDTRGRFEIGLLRLLGASLGGNRADVLSIEAEKREYHLLKDTRDVFRRLSDSPKVREWVNDMVLYKTPCYMVIGLEVVHDAHFSRLVHNRAEAGGYVKVPTEMTHVVPVSAKGEAVAEGLGQSSGNKVSGVFGIQVQRLNTAITIREPGRLALGRDASWKWSYQKIKGNQQAEQEKELAVSLVDVEIDELTSIMAMDDAENDEDSDDEE